MVELIGAADDEVTMFAAFALEGLLAKRGGDLKKPIDTYRLINAAWGIAFLMVEAKKSPYRPYRLEIPKEMEGEEN